MKEATERAEGGGWWVREADAKENVKRERAVVAQIKSSDVEAVADRLLRGAAERRFGEAAGGGDGGAKRIEKKFYEGLTGGLGRPDVYEEVYPAASGPMDRPTMYNVGRSRGVRDPGRRFWRRVGHKVTGSRSPLVPLFLSHRRLSSSSRSR